MSKDTTGNAGSETWRPIETAPKDTGKEILDVKYFEGVMRKEPFISFWSPTLGRFFCDPTHWMPLPDPPDTTEAP